MTNTAAMIAVHHIRPALKGAATLEERVQRAFKEAQSFWMSTDDQVRFRGACAAVMLETADEFERERWEKSLRVVNTLGVLMAGVPVNLDEVVQDLETFKPVPILKMWQEAKAANARC